MTITKKELDQLRANRPDQNRELHYTIGGPAEAYVHASVEAERIGRLVRGDRRLQQALQQLRQDQAFASREGLSKAHFNAHGQTPTVKPGR